MNFPFSLGSSGQALTIEAVVINLLLAFVLGLLVVGVYRVTNRNKAINVSFLMTMLILSMVVALVMMVIGNSIARAFSLVGALSIIRFRSVVKDNRDIAYIFLALAAGMGAGIGLYAVAIFGVGTILVILLLLDFVKFGQSMHGLFLLRFQYFTNDTEEGQFSPVFDRLLTSYRRVSVKSVRMGQFIEHSYLIRLRKGVQEQQLISELSAVEGMERVTLLAEDVESEV